MNKYNWKKIEIELLWEDEPFLPQNKSDMIL